MQILLIIKPLLQFHKMVLLSPQVYLAKHYAVYIRSLMFYFVPGKPSELRGVRSRSAEEGGSSSSLSDVLESFVGKLKDCESHVCRTLRMTENHAKRTDYCPVMASLDGPSIILGIQQHTTMPTYADECLFSFTRQTQ